MITFPNAKINIGLNVVSKRPDGYHDISSVMVPVDWCDILEAVPADETELTLTGNSVDCPIEKNLVVKALRAVGQHVGHALNCHIYLRKIIPDGAGLGGGSSDASFTIKLIDELFSLGLENEEMERIAAGIGADCPFFIRNRPVYVTGIGDVMTPVEINLLNYKLLIVKPPESISTAQAYAGITPSEPGYNLQEAIRLPIEKWKAVIKNDFEPVVFRHFPYFERIKEDLYLTGACYASMSGSGSAFFGIYPPHTDNLAEIAHGFSVCGYKTHIGSFKF